MSSDDLDPDDGEPELAETEQAAYSGWYTVAAKYWSAQIRVCKTSTRINWQFTNNTWWNVQTAGDAIPNLVTYIEGVASGSKYRTRAGTAFWINFYSAGYGAAKLFTIAEIPNC